MESKHQELLERQEAVTQAIRKIGVNFTKDSAQRKTSKYLRVRLDSLHNLWEEFDINNTVLQGARDKSGEYFTIRAYEKTQVEFTIIKQKLETCKPYDAASDTSGGETEREAGGFSKTDELTTLQGTNFRAFSRFIRNLNIDHVTEKWDIEDKLRTLQSRWKPIDDVHWQIDNLLVGCDVDRELEFSKFEATYERTKAELSCKLNNTIQQCESAPKIEIPTFSGDYAQWPTFLDLYSEAIHKNPSVPKARKMQHLKGKLRGEAERLVQHLSVSADNYDSCWKILNHRYNNIQLLFTKQMQAFMNQPTIQHQNAHELKRLHDTTLETIHAIHNLGVDVTTWDPMLVYILTQKLDAQTYSDYMEARESPRELPAFQEFIQFIENKFTALEPVAKKKQAFIPYNKQQSTQNKESPSTSNNNNNSNKTSFNNYRQHPKIYHANTSRNCPVCKENHILISCKSFQEMSSDMKIRSIDQLNICKNCLFSHNENKCNSNKRCKVCNNAHHTTLHDVIRDTTPLLTPSVGQQSVNNPSTAQGKANHVSGNFNEVLLATTQLRIRAANGTYITLRCLLDQGSQINIITESAAQRLGLQRQNQNSTVSGIGISTNQSNGTVHLQCESLYGDYNFTTQALVMAKMLNNLPNNSFEKQDWEHVQSINLADPDYNVSRAVDILLDAGVYANIIMSGILRGPIHAPIAQQTKLGWILVGNTKTFNCHVLVNKENISRFWEIEQITENNNSTTAEDENCENLYANTRRLEHGRFEVKIPVKQNFKQQLGASKSQAVTQFRQLEKRLANNETLSSIQEAQHQLINMLKGGGFNHHTWASNNTSLHPNSSEYLINEKRFDFKDAETNKTLGITWNPHTDHFTYKQTSHSKKRDVNANRTPLSNLSKLHDPLGWLAAITVVGAKLIYQQAWTATTSWDEPLPENIQQDWEHFREGLTCVYNIKIPRWIGNIQKPIELNEPRLELCGAALLSRLIKRVIDTTNSQTVTVHGRTDSMVVMHILSNHALGWTGPSWLQTNKIPSKGTFTTTEEEKKRKQTKAPLREMHSSMTQVTRALSWMMRFVNNARDVNTAKRTSYLTTADIESSHNIIIKIVQHINFADRRYRYCILGRMKPIKRHLIKCVTCHRFKTQNNSQEMADLPRPQFSPSRSSSHTGVGFTEHVEVKANNMKRPRTKLSRLSIEQEKVNNTANSEEQPDDKRSDTRTAKPRRQLRSASAKTAALATYISTLVVLLITCVAPSAQQLINVTTLEPSRLMYFDKVADMQIIEEEWKMIVYYNMSTYWKSVTNIEQYVDHLQGLCKRKLAYLTIASQFAHELNELKHYNQVLESEHGTRTKRGLVNGIGNLANSLFGVLDDRFAERYNKDITLLQGDQGHLLSLYKQHTSIIEGEYNLLKRNEQVMNQQFIIINKHLRETEQQLKMEQDTAMYVTATALAANMIITNLRRVQETILDLVTDVRNGKAKVDTHLLKPDAFETQLNIISGQLPKGLSLPCTSSHKCTREMYQLSRVHVKLVEDVLLFEVKIPLVANELYELTKVMPINNSSGKTMIRVIPTAEYLAVNLRKDMLIPLNQRDLSTCVQFHRQQLLCTLNTPVYEIKTNSLCEARILNNQVAPAVSSCRTEVSRCKDEWTNLHSRGAWLFTCCEECSVRIFCPSGVTSLRLRNTGVIHLPNGCLLRGEHHSIHAHYHLQSEWKIEDEELNIPPHSINDLINTNYNVSLFDMQPVSQDEELKTLKEKIDVVKEQQEKINLNSLEGDPHHYVLYGFITICGLSLGIWRGLKLKAACTSGNRGKPAQETSEQIEMGDITVQTEERSPPTARPKDKKMDRATSPLN